LKGGHFRVPFLSCLNEIPREIPWTYKLICSWSRFRTALPRPQDPADCRLQTLNKTLAPETPTRTTVAACRHHRWLVQQCGHTVQRANRAAHCPRSRHRQRTSAAGRCPVASDGWVIPGITTRAKRAVPRDYARRVTLSMIWYCVPGLRHKSWSAGVSPAKHERSEKPRERGLRFATAAKPRPGVKRRAEDRLRRTRPVNGPLDWPIP